MQKRSARVNGENTNSGAPLLVCLFFGVLFFGTYLVLERRNGTEIPSLKTALAFIGAYTLLAALTVFFYYMRDKKRRSEQTLSDSLNTKMHNLFKYVVKLPYLICDETGRVRVINSALQELLEAKDPFFRGNLSDICGGITLQQIIAKMAKMEESRRHVGKLTMDVIQAAEKAPAPQAEEDASAEGLVVHLRSGGRFAARAYEVGLTDHQNYLVTFTDISELLDLKEKAERDMPAVAYIDIDNLEELAQYTRVSYRDASAKIDDILITFAARINGFLREYEKDRYLLIFSQDKLLECEKEKFSTLLDGVRAVRLGEYSIPVTVSVGISVSDCTMAERAAEAASALDMALQRGGDQVAVRRKEGIRYYGGQTRSFQRRTKVQSRVVANYLLSKISVADNLLVMGHRNPDFDSIGAAIGVAQLGLFAGVKTKVIIDLENPNFKIATERLVASDTYKDLFITGHRGLDLVRPGTLLIITDANNFDIIESPEVANSVKQISGKIAIIDHHRQTGEYDFEPVMNYIDTSASSASELVSEMLDQSETGNDVPDTNLLSDEVASVLLSGIMLDTSGFTRNTGSRTLDAARYLFGKGANSEYVHSFFHVDYESYERERSFSGSMLLRDGDVGLTWSAGTGNGSADRVAAAKEAEKLLGVKGIHASFALVVIDGAVHISGRSDGSVNVQLILERLGGGGRFDSAGAALQEASIETAVADLEKAINAYFSELESNRKK